MEYLSVAETAKLLRGALGRAFPGVKFSVRSSKYAGGASVRVRWTDGPAPQAVGPVAQQFAGARFDGSIDMQTTVSHYLLPDGTVSLAHQRGTQDSGGFIPPVENSLPPGAREVRLGADYVSLDRDVTDYAGKALTAAALIRAQCTCEGDLPNDRFGNRWVKDLASQMVMSQGEGETLQQAFRRVVLREGS